MCEDRKNVKNGVLRKELTSWKDFVDFVADATRSWGTLIYRGQANADWKVVSTLDRLEKRFHVAGGTLEHDPHEIQLKRFKELARGKFVSHLPPSDEDVNEWWALAQHYGLATPMLDWTYSPFVALFFAFESEKCECNGEYKKPAKRAVFALTHHLISSGNNSDGQNRKKPLPFSPKGHANYRLTNQGGLFLRMPDPELEDTHSNGTMELKYIDLEGYIEKNFSNDTYEDNSPAGNLNPSIILQKFTISNSDRVRCLRFLDHMNINRASLFPDLDGAARYANDLWEVNPDKAIGYINENGHEKNED